VPTGPLNLRELANPFIRTGKDDKRLSGPGWGYVFGLIGTVFFAMKAIMVKLAYLPGGGLGANEIEPITLVALRLAFALPVYLVILIWALRRLGIPDTGLALRAAALGALGYYLCAFLDFSGLLYITAQLERLLLFTYPIFVMVLGALFFGIRINLKGVLAIALAYMGIVVVFVGGDIASGDNVLLGSIFVLSAAFFFAIYQLLAKPVINRLGSERFTCIAMMTAACIAMLHFYVTHPGAEAAQLLGDLPPRIYILAAMLAILSTIIPSFLITIALGRIGALRSGYWASPLACSTQPAPC